MVYATSLPENSECEKITEDGETLYACDGVLYRSTYYEDEKVYEIVSDPPADEGQPQSVVGMGLTDPFTRGETVKELQNRLVGAGYDVGGVDGVFGSGTETAVMWLQYDNGIESTGVIDPPTAQLLGYDVPGAQAPATPPAAPDPEAAVPADPATDAEAEAPANPAPATDTGAAVPAGPSPATDADDASVEPEN
ncbi:peptidoglycan-binding protein [Parasedimentitalea marina]|uniref:Peptidoglycan-binding protein n=1 Tax=Parasedimentitalea marina TaxID=2483033 RepID=A0A3T0N1Z2_9RHOB|nr:peptidoglycan-binding domain-containing protein [Parasedimentitalea marina]AZV78058.1 peptidoglycan-binding protein [Parasedimentitalea marina]